MGLNAHNHSRSRTVEWKSADNILQIAIKQFAVKQKTSKPLKIQVKRTQQQKQGRYKRAADFFDVKTRSGRAKNRMQEATRGRRTRDKHTIDSNKTPNRAIKEMKTTAVKSASDELAKSYR